MTGKHWWMDDEYVDWIMQRQEEIEKEQGLWGLEWRIWKWRMEERYGRWKLGWQVYKRLGIDVLEKGGSAIAKAIRDSTWNTEVTTHRHRLQAEVEERWWHSEVTEKVARDTKRFTDLGMQIQMQLEAIQTKIGLIPTADVATPD